MEYVPWEPSEFFVLTRRNSVQLVATGGHGYGKRQVRHESGSSRSVEFRSPARLAAGGPKGPGQAWWKTCCGEFDILP